MTSNNPRPQQPVSPYYAPQLQQHGEDIIANDITTGGYPQITVHDGEQLKIAHCRTTFTKVQ